jgi:hypothetical protein
LLISSTNDSWTFCAILDQPTPSYRLEVNPSNQFFPFIFSQLMSLGLIEPLIKEDGFSTIQASVTLRSITELPTKEDGI